MAEVEFDQVQSDPHMQAAARILAGIAIRVAAKKREGEREVDEIRGRGALTENPREAAGNPRQGVGQLKGADGGPSARD